MTKIVLALGIVGLSILAGLAVPGIVPADEPQLVSINGLNGFCIVPRDAATRAFYRSACDEAAQTAGFAHGVLLPCVATGLCEKDACKLPDARPYVCTGVGGQAEE
jgi:hypothetical protein